VHPSRIAFLAALGVLSVGCYALQPAGGVKPVLGTAVGFDINDAGRVALGGSMGPEIGQVAGRLVAQDSEEYTLAVSDVEFLRGDNQVWRGEEVHIKTNYVSTIYVRRFSPARTIALGAIGVGAVALFLGKTLANSFLDNSQHTDSTSATSRGRLPRRPIHAPLLRSPNPPRSY